MDPGHYDWIRPTKVRRELGKLRLSRDEATKLADAVERIAQRKPFPKDWDTLDRGVEEVRCDVAHRTVRVYFARYDDRLVLLCLHAHIKKKTNDRNAVSLAAKRLRQYERGEWGQE